jgi:HNH endonuclease
LEERRSMTVLAARKPIGKRLRFEVFKRDGFVCQYCGAHPPGAILEVDHITAVAAGGGNDIDNLVTACFPCNRGKGAVDLSTIPQTLSSKAAEIAEAEAQLAGYSAIIEAKRKRIESEVWRVVKALTGEGRCSHDHFHSVSKFVQLLGVHETLEAVEITRVHPRTRDARWRYFFGVCWSKVREAGL